MSKKLDELKHQADQLLQEIRIVLPGTQALMGFQFIAFFNPVFQNLQPGLKYLHFSTLLLTILTSIFLISPVAFQQIGEQGKVTPKFLTYTRRMISIAMMLLLLSFIGDVFLAARVINISNFYSGLIAASLFGIGVYFWYVYSAIRRNR
ncbi:MAG: DUF6328 family protein [bacterium]|nr:DUF6328 family protein [bacterium]